MELANALAAASAAPTLSISEILDLGDEAAGAAQIIGEVAQVDPHLRQAVLQHGRHELPVDLCTLELDDIATGDLLQFTGELCCRAGVVIFSARALLRRLGNVAVAPPRPPPPPPLDAVAAGMRAVSYTHLTLPTTPYV